MDGPLIDGREGSIEMAEKGSTNRYRKDIDCAFYLGFLLISKTVKTNNYFHL